MFKGIFGKRGKKTLWSIVGIGMLQVLATCCTVGLSAMICLGLYICLVDKKTALDAYVLPLSLEITFIILSFVFSLLQDRLSLNTSSRIRTTLRREVFDKALKLGTLKNHYMPHSSLTTMALEGIEELDSFYTGFLPSAIYGLIMPFILLALCLILNATLDFATPLAYVFGVSMIAILPFIPIMIGMMCMSIGKVFGNYWGIYLRMGSAFTDSLHGLSILKDFNTSKRKGKQIDDQSEEFRKITMKVLITELVALTVLDLLSFGGVGSGMIIAIYYGATSNSMSVWILSIFLILIVFEFFIPMRNVASLAMVAGRGVMAFKRIKNFLSIPDQQWGNERPDLNSISIENVSFKYADSKDEIALKDISFNIDKNGLYGLVGISGSGKSTLAALLTGSLSPTQGSINFSNVPLKSISKDWFFSNVGLIQGFSSIPASNIRELFNFYNPNISDEEIIKCMKEFLLDSLIDNPLGLDYQIKEMSKNVSVGEKQRLLMAASLTNHRNIWIFDEVSSALDKESMKIIDEKIENLSKESIVIMISHRLIETNNASMIYVMEKGMIVERGTSEQLLSANGSYACLYQSQEGGVR